MTHAHLLPRAYIWGLADILRAGFEGRTTSLYFFGKYDNTRAPWYFSPGVLLVKLPLGVFVLAATGTWLMLTRRCPHALALPLSSLLGLAMLFLAFLARSHAGYAGVLNRRSVARDWQGSLVHLSVSAKGQVWVAGVFGA